MIVPSRGVADAIATELLKAMPHGFAALRIQTIDELATRIAGEGPLPRIASEAERRLAMRAATRAVNHPVMDSRGVASMLERAYRDARDSGVTLADVSRRMASTRTRPLVGVVTRAWADYERLIAQLGAGDPSDRLRRATQLVDGNAPLEPRFLLAGFYDMTGAQLQFVEALLRRRLIEGIWVPTEARFAHAFVSAVGLHAEVAREPVIASAAPRLEAVQYDNGISELRDVCARVGALLRSGTSPNEIGIVARTLQPYDAHLLNRFAREHGFATTLHEEIPLTAHRLGRAAVTLLRLRERGFPRTEVLELVRDGLRTRTRIDVDEVDAATRRARVAGGTSEELRLMRTRTAHVEAYIALVAELEQLTSSIGVDLLTQLTGMLHIETQSDLDAAAKLDEVAYVFRRTAVWGRGLDVASVVDAIEQETLAVATRAEDGLPLIWAGEILRFRGRSFTHLFAVRMQDDVFPQRRTEDALLFDADRKRLGIRQIGDGRDEEALLFSLLGDSSRHVHFSFAISDGFGKALRPSRYLRTIDTSVWSGESPTSSQVMAAPRHRPLQLLARAGTRSVFDGYLGSLPKEIASLSPTQLEDFGECPQKFLLKHLLGVRDIDDPEREVQINHREKGTIDHRILERFHRSMHEADYHRAAAALPRLPSDLSERLDQIIDAEFDEHEALYPPFNQTIRAIERRATKRILREFLAADIADLSAQGLLPRWFEYKFGTKHRDAADHPDPFVVEAGGVPVRVEGTIDRIDADGSRYRIVDYKSGKALRHVSLGDKIDRGVRLQLALYAMAVSEFFGADPGSVTAAIKPLVSGEHKAEKFAFALEEKRDRVVETLEIFMRAIERGEFPAFPEEKDFDSCKYCPVNLSCRTRHDQEERQAVQRSRDPRTLLGGGEA